jgi:hypothetical protein
MKIMMKRRPRRPQITEAKRLLDSQLLRRKGR